MFNNIVTHSAKCNAVTFFISLSYVAMANLCDHYYGLARKQNGGSNQCIRVYTAILSPGNIQQHLKPLEAAYICCPSIQYSTNSICIAVNKEQKQVPIKRFLKRNLANVGMAE